MNNSVNSNIYAFDAMRVLESYADYVRGDANCTIMVISKARLGDLAVDAICKSTEKLGFGKDACAWTTLLPGLPGNGDADLSCSFCLPCDGGKESDGLDSEALRDLIEGIDPISIIVTDSDSADAVACSYDVDMECDAFNRANGRTVIAFTDFEGMLNDIASKQVAWRLLKRL